MPTPVKRTFAPPPKTYSHSRGNQRHGRPLKFTASVLLNMMANAGVAKPPPYFPPLLLYSVDPSFSCWAGPKRVIDGRNNPAEQSCGLQE